MRRHSVKKILAKLAFMYYPYLEVKRDRKCKTFNNQNRSIKFITLLVFFLSFLTYQTNVYADTKSELIEDYRTQGYVAQQKGQYRRALEFYSKALEVSSGSAIILNDLGVLYEQMGSDQRAEGSYLKAIEFDETYMPSYLNLAYLYKKNGRLNDAARYFLKRVRKSPVQDDWVEKAKQELFAIDPAYRDLVITEQAEALKRELVKKAHNEFYETMSLASEHYAEAEKFSKNEQYDEAIGEFNKALALSPSNPKYLKARDAATLESNKRKWIDLTIESSNNAVKLIKLGDVSSAKVEFRKILSTLPDDPIR